MSEQNQNSSMSIASQVGMGIGPIISGIFNNLWASKERRRIQEYNIERYNQERLDNRTDATTQYERSLDVRRQMQAFKEAGINPYMVASQGTNAPATSSAQSHSLSPAPGNFDFIGQIPMQMMQMKLINAQIKDINASAQKKETETTGQDLQNKLTKQFGFLEKSVGIQQQQQTITNMESTQKNIDASTQLLGAQTGYESVKTQIAVIQKMYEDAKQQLQLEGMTWNNRESQSRINYSLKQIQQLDAIMSKIASEIELNKEAIETGNLNQHNLYLQGQKIIQETNLSEEYEKTEREMRPYKKAGTIIDQSRKTLEHIPFIRRSLRLK